MPAASRAILVFESALNAELLAIDSISSPASASVIASTGRGGPERGAVRFEQPPEERLRLDFLGAEADERQHRRRVRRPQQLVEQRRAVGIGPVKIVDVDDDGPAPGEAVNQLTQCGKRVPPQHERIGNLEQSAPGGVSRPRTPAPASSPGTGARARRCRAARAARRPCRAATSGSGSSCRRRRPVLCRAPTRARSSAP